MSKDMEWSCHTTNWVPSLSPFHVSLSLTTLLLNVLLGPQKVSSPQDNAGPGGHGEAHF